MRRLLAQWLRWGEGMVDNSIPPNDILVYLERSLQKMEEDIQMHEENWSGRMLSEFEYARQVVAEIGGHAPNFPQTVEPIHSFLPDFHTAKEWLEGLPEGRVIIRNQIERGTGSNLRAVLLHDDPDLRSWLNNSLERLLRHVEVRRKAALIVDEANPETQWIERTDVAILFLEVSRKSGDLRFLNTAMKLNDWAFQSHRRLPIGPRFTRYIFSLAEQEEMTHELMQT